MREDNNINSFGSQTEDNSIETPPNQRDDHPVDVPVDQRNDHPVQRDDSSAANTKSDSFDQREDNDVGYHPVPVYLPSQNNSSTTSRKSSKSSHTLLYILAFVVITLIANLVIWFRFPDGLRIYPLPRQSNTEDANFTINFDSNGGDDKIEAVSASTGSFVELPVVKRTYIISYNANGGQMTTLNEKHTLECQGWSDEKKASYSKFACGSNYQVNNDATLYAVWSPEITVSVTDDIPTRSGHRFLGWSTNEYASDASCNPDGELSLSESITLYAVWETVFYTSGYMSKGEYINNWAGIRIPVNELDIISVGDGLLENNMEKGVSLASDTSELDISFVYGFPDGIESEEEFLKKDITDFVNERTVITISEEVYGKTMIANQLYNSCLVTMTGQNDSVSYMLFCIKRIDDKLCYIRVVAMTKEDLQDAIDMIKLY